MKKIYCDETGDNCQQIVQSLLQPLLTKKDGCDITKAGVSLRKSIFQPLLTKKDGCDVMAVAAKTEVYAFNHSSRRRMVVTGLIASTAQISGFQPLLTKKDGCDGLWAYCWSERPLTFQPLLTKKDGCDRSCRSYIPQESLNHVDREPGQSYFSR